MAAPSLPAHRFHSSEDCARAGIAVRQPAPMTLTPRKTQTTFRRMREPQSHVYLILNGMMMSPPNVNCELFVPAPKGVVPFKEVSYRISGRITNPSNVFGTVVGLM